MAYTMSASGRKTDVLGSLRQQAASQSAGLPSQNERDQVTKSIDDAEAVVNQYAGDNDSVSVTLSGQISQSDTALSVTKNCGISISRGAAGPATGAPTPGASAATPAPTSASGTNAAGTGAAPSPNPRI